MFLAFFAGLVLLVVVYVVVTYNSLVAQIEAIRNSQRQIDVQLDRRYKVFESLIQVLKNYMDYEKSTLSEIVRLRSLSRQQAARGDDEGHMASENAISSLLPQINAQFEAYPELKANQNALQLQEEVVSTENKLSFAKQAYNDALEQYNAAKASFFARFVVLLFARSLEKAFAYWSLDDAKRKEREDYSVKL